MSRTKKFAYNTAASTLREVVAVGTGFIVPWFMLKYYGSEINGLVISIMQFIAYFSIIEAGLGSSIIYSLYEPLAKKDKAKINGIVAASRKFYIRAGLVFTGLVCLLALIYPFFVKIDGFSNPKLGLLVLVIGFSGSLDFFALAKYRTLLSADQKTYVVSIGTIIYKIVEMLVIVVFSLLQADILIMRAFTLSAMLSRTVFLSAYVRKFYSWIDYQDKPDNSALAKRWDAMFLQIMQSVQTGSPIILLTLMTKDLKMVSVYSIYNMIINGVRGIFEILVTSSTASFGEIISLKDRVTLQKVYKTYEYVYYSLITMVYGICMVMILPFIKLYTKGVAENYVIPIIGALFVVNGLLHNIKSPQALLVNASGMFKETRWQTTIQALIIIIGGMVLVPRLKIVGMLLALIASNIYRDIDLIWFAAKNITKLPLSISLIRVFRLGIAFVIIIAPFYIIEIAPDSFVKWMFYAMGVGVYAIVVIMAQGFIFEKQEVRNVYKKIKEVWRI